MRSIATLLSCALFASDLLADDTKIVSTTDGSNAVGGVICDLSADGRFVLFSSASPDLVADDTNGYFDLFVRDRQLGTVVRVNVGSDGSQDELGGGLYPMEGTISGDGRFVAFTSVATFDPADNSDADIYLRDLVDGTTTLVSHSDEVEGINRNSNSPHISRDGAFVAFASTVPNLVPDEVNPWPDIFRWERSTGAIELASVNGDGVHYSHDCRGPRISGAGGVVTYFAWIHRGDVTRNAGMYLKDFATGSLEFVDGLGGCAAISADGRHVLFSTWSALVPEDVNEATDAYLLDRDAGTVERVSLGTGFRELSSHSGASGMSDDMRWIEFQTAADASGDGGGDGFIDNAYRFDRETGVALRVSIGPDDETAQANCIAGPISGDGRVAMFSTASSSVWPGDTNELNDVFVREISDVPAAWSNYGSGLAGRFGVPDLALTALPRRTTTLGLDVGNSSGLYTLSVLFVGFASASIPTSFGGTLLVDPFTTLMLPLTPYDDEFSFTIPSDGDLPGVHLYLQALELDAWAVKGVSFTAGLDLTIGD